MARPKKPKYEYVERLGLYRKRVKDINGKYVAVYGKNPDELTDKIADFHEAQKNGAEIKDNLLFNDYAQRWMDLHGAIVPHVWLSLSALCAQHFSFECNETSLFL